MTLFDHRYLPRGVAMYQSLSAHCDDFLLWVVALSPECEHQLCACALPNVKVVPLNEIERAIPELVVAKGNRSLVEYYYTLSSAACEYVIQRVADNDLVTYLDADLFFFASPEPVFQRIGNSSVGITPHRFSPGLERYEKVGKYNVGWVTFRRDAAGTACLKWWVARCLEWCYERQEAGKYADQGYLDSFPKLFDNVCVVDAPGINLAPWNLGQHRVEMKHGSVVVDGEPLVFFHFAEVRQLSRWHYSTGTAAGRVWLTWSLRRTLYWPYIATLRRIAPGGLPSGARRPKLGSIVSRAGLRALAKGVFKIVMAEYVVAFGDRLF